MSINNIWLKATHWIHSTHKKHLCDMQTNVNSERIRTKIELYENIKNTNDNFSKDFCRASNKKEVRWYHTKLNMNSSSVGCTAFMLWIQKRPIFFFRLGRKNIINVIFVIYPSESAATAASKTVCPLGDYCIHYGKISIYRTLNIMNETKQNKIK